MAVIMYIRNTERRFDTFVANRVARILESSMSEQWRHVPSALNPADDVNRGLRGTEFTKNCRWIRGPPFLLESENLWPKIHSPNQQLLNDDPEVKAETTAISSTTKFDQRVKLLEELRDRYSSWYRLLKGVAWLRRFVDWKCKVNKM